MTIVEILEQAKQLSRQERKTLIMELIETLDAEEEKHYTAKELLMMPVEKRNRILANAFESAANEDFEIFEAYSEDDFDDYDGAKISATLI